MGSDGPVPAGLAAATSLHKPAWQRAFRGHDKALLGVVTPAKAGVHVLHTQPKDFDGTLTTAGEILGTPGLAWHTTLDVPVFGGPPLDDPRQVAEFIAHLFLKGLGMSCSF